MLNKFQIAREALENANFSRNPRHISGLIQITSANLDILVSLQENGHIESCTINGRSHSHLADNVDQGVQLVLNPQSLAYYEDLQDLVSYTSEEPKKYYVYGVGEVIAEADGGTTTDKAICAYRQLLHARKLLRLTADDENPGKAVFFTPERIEVPLAYSCPEIPFLRHLKELESQFEKRPEKDPADFDQRLVLFRKNIREYLKTQPPGERFGLFLKNFETIYDSYIRDYQLWVGNTFGELEKTFEEKRLKFVADLNGILAGVQAAILAVPITAILLGDKYDLGDPMKDFLLAVGVLLVGIVALRLLQNQEATLDATDEAISATKQDFERKHTRRMAEFQSRLQSLDTQEKRVRSLLFYIRNITLLIIIAAFIGWLVAFSRTVSTPNINGKSIAKPNPVVAKVPN